MTTAKESKEKKLSGTSTKTEKPTMIQKNQLENRKKRQKKKKKRRKKDQYPPAPPHIISVLHHNNLFIIAQNWCVSIATRNCHQWALAVAMIKIKKWDNKSCLACGKTLLDERMWNDILGQRGTCDKSCQYTILISDWCPHDNDKIWRMAFAKIEGDPEPVINFLDPKQFHEHYQELAPTREEQEQHLEQLNTQLC
ncbi:hypothetical protein G9A89_013277 [Geosiphon pyriformis]|nr:hypothetical protein G9A89_013277 [Geosiphon pyriformis]